MLYFAEGSGGERRARANWQIGDSEHRDFAVEERNPIFLPFDHSDSQRHEQPEDASRLRRARSVVIPGDDDDLRFRQPLRKPLELAEGVKDRGIRRANGVKNVAGDENNVRLQLDDLVHYPVERARDVGFALVQPRLRLPLILAEAEVDVGEVDDSHLRFVALVHTLTLV